MAAMDSTALVRSILDLSTTLRLDTVAEGIEDSGQRDVLRDLGAQQGQGYLFARPMGPEDLADLLAGADAAGDARNGSSTPPTAATRTTRSAHRNPPTEALR